jgi:GNAT superfamily N-acetyltransferase
MTLTIRELRPEDHPAVHALDTAFTTAAIYDVVVAPTRLELVTRALPTPRVKRYPMADAFAPWARWDVGFVATAAIPDRADGGPDDLVGFAAIAYEAWHARLVLWHLYVAPPHRRAGVGRALLDRVEAHGRGLGAQRVWLETTSVNVPGIAAYARLGYALCGVDTTAYDALPYADEAAVYLAKRL